MIKEWSVIEWRIVMIDNNQNHRRERLLIVDRRDNDLVSTMKNPFIIPLLKQGEIDSIRNNTDLKIWIVLNTEEWIEILYFESFSGFSIILGIQSSFSQNDLDQITDNGRNQGISFPIPMMLLMESLLLIIYFTYRITCKNRMWHSIVLWIAQ